MKRIDIDIGLSFLFPHFNGLNPFQVTGYIAEIRKRNGGSLSGLSQPVIIARVATLVKPEQRTVQQAINAGVVR